MKLLYIYNLYQQPGGENQWVQSEPDLFRARGHEVFIYRRDNCDIRDFSLWKRAALLWESSWSQQSYDEVRALIRRERPDVAHVYTLAGGDVKFGGRTEYAQEDGVLKVTLPKREEAKPKQIKIDVGTLAPIDIVQTEVTVAQYAAFIKASGNKTATINGQDTPIGGDVITIQGKRTTARMHFLLRRNRAAEVAHTVAEIVDLTGT